MPRTERVLWRNPTPKRSYDAVIVGGGGHGLATAYYLAKDHGVRDVAVLERGWLAGGNMARNTTVIRSNYLRPESARIYEHALQMWESLAAELEYDIQLSQRGVISLVHNRWDVREARRRIAANQFHGIDADWLEPDDVVALCPTVNISPDTRYPVLGAAYQARGGIARHDHVAWGYARAADALGVDLIQECEVTGLDIAQGRVTGLRTSLGPIRADRVALTAAGHSTQVAAMAGIDVPLQSRPLQALVTEILEPIHPSVVLSNSVHVYVSQAHKGELVVGAGIDAYNSYAQRGSFNVIEQQIAAALELFPIFAGAHVIRTWAGIVDLAPDASPIIGRTDVGGLYLNCGWGTGGFKATPVAGLVLAWTVARDKAHELAEPYGLERFARGRLIDEHTAAVAH